MNETAILASLGHCGLKRHLSIPYKVSRGIVMIILFELTARKNSCFIHYEKCNFLTIGLTAIHASKEER
jgi:hypothetical protein